MIRFSKAKTSAVVLFYNKLVGADQIACVYQKCYGCGFETLICLSNRTKCIIILLKFGSDSPLNSLF